MVNKTAPAQKPLSAARAINISVACLGLYLALQVASSFGPSFASAMMSQVLYAIGDYSTVMVMSGWISVLYSVLLFVATLVSGGLTSWIGLRLSGESLKAQVESNQYDHSWIYKGVCMAFAMNFLLSLVVSLLNALLGIFGAEIDEVGLATDGGFFGFLMNFASAVVLAPLFEEIVFRGVICKSLSRFNKGFAVIFSALLFAIAHLNLYQGIPVFGMGIVFAFVYLRSGSLRVPILMHVINNFLALVQTYSPDILSIVFLILMLVLTVLGLYFIYKERRQFAGVFKQNSQAGMEWKLVLHNAGFWVLVVIFMAFSFLSTFGTLLLNSFGGAFY